MAYERFGGEDEQDPTLQRAVMAQMSGPSQPQRRPGTFDPANPATSHEVAIPTGGGMRDVFNSRPGYERDRTMYSPGSSAGAAGFLPDPSMGAAGSSAANVGQAGGSARFTGKNWEGLTRSGGGGQFADRLEGFDTAKLGDTGNTIGDSNTSKYAFASVAQNYDPSDPQAFEKIVADLRKMGINAQYDGKDAIDFGDGYGWIDVSRAWEAGKGGQGWAWMPKGGGGQAAGGGAPLPNSVGQAQAMGGGLPFVGDVGSSKQLQEIQAEINRLLNRQEPSEAMRAQMRG